MQNRGRTGKQRSLVILIVSFMLIGAFAGRAGAQSDDSCDNSGNTTSGKTPLSDLGSGTYQGVSGGLYPNGRPNRPPEHEAAGINIAMNQVQPLDGNGNPDPANGKIVMISVGMSNTNMMFAGMGGPSNVPVAFMTRANNDPAKNPQLVIVNGAQGKRAAEDWISPDADTWDNVDQFLAEAGVSPAQVQIAWVKQTIRGSRGSFPDRAAVRQGYFEDIARNLVIRYPSIKLAYYSSRTYSYTRGSGKSPEPVAYEDGFAVRWMIEKQINGDSGLNYDASQGPVMAPWLSWGPYLWTDGLNPRSDGYVWRFEDQGCGVHPQTPGVAKNAAQLFAFFKTDPTTTPWFLRQDVVGQPPQDVVVVADPPGGPAPLTVQFNASATDPDGRIVETVWTFDDGTFSYNPDADPADPLLLQNKANPTKTFFVPGTYHAHVTITDDAGNAVTQTVTVVVEGEATAGDPAPETNANEEEDTATEAEATTVAEASQDTSEEDTTTAATPAGADLMDVTATAVSPTRIDLSWPVVAGDVRGFEIERSPDGEGGWTEIAQVGPEVTTFSDTGLSPGTPYFYRVRVSRRDGNSTYLNVAAAVTELLPTPTATMERPTAPAVPPTRSNPGLPDGAPASFSTSWLYLIGAGAAAVLAAVWLVVRGRRS